MAAPGKSVTITGGTARITFADTDDWGSGFIGGVTITNLGTAALSEWTLSFDLGSRITTIWNAEIVSVTGTHYVIRNAAYNGAVAPGGTVSFGFQADGGNPALPTSFTLNGVVVGEAAPPPPPSGPTLSIDDQTFVQTGAKNVKQTFTIRLSEPATKTVKVAWQTVDGTAKAGTDYDAASGTVSFKPGETEKTITIVTHPGAPGATLGFTVALSAPTNATIADGSGAGSIVNPGAPPVPTLSIDDQTVVQTGAKNVKQTFTIRLSDPATKVVKVDWQTVDGTAKAGTDYNAASGTVSFKPGETEKTITIVTHPGSTGTLDFSIQLSGASNAAIADGTGLGTIVNPGAPPPPPQPPLVTVADITVQQAPVSVPPAGPTSLLPAGFLHTAGNQIVDASGTPVKIAAVNWFGLETKNYAPHGLWAASYKTMIDQMVQLGFNTIRLPYSDQLFAPGSTPNGIDFYKNPDLAGLNGQQIMDRIIDYAGQKGMKVILDHHRSSAGDGPNANGLWYDSAYPEATMIQNWVQLAQRYANNPTVIGADLANEPHGPATWGDGSANDWAAAATRIGNAILAANPNWLILVEGIESYKGNATWWGGNLMGVKDHPITLNVPGRLVYSPHDYPASVYNQRWFSDPGYPNNLPAVWDQYWGFIYKSDTAPILLGEFGTSLKTASDQAWLNKLVAYLDESSANGGLPVTQGELGPSWAYWSWNPNSGDTGGILQADWKTVETAKMVAIDPLLFRVDYGSGPVQPVASGTASFVVSLSAASTLPVTVTYHTVDLTAKAGIDYAPLSGTLTFQPGETAKVLSTQLYAMPGETGQMAFLLALDQATNAALGSTSATAILVKGSTAPPLSVPDPAPQPTGGPVSLAVTDDWGSGYVGAVSVTNTSGGAVNGWRVEITTNDLITGIWNATILGHSAGTYLIGNADWNGSLGSGATTSFGFQASNTDPTDTVTAQLLRFGT